MFELNGEQYSLQQVEEAAKQSNMSLDDYISEYGLIKIEDEGKTAGVADKGATVTPTTGQAPEVTELESVDISLDSQPKRSVRGETRKRELEDRSVEDQEEKTTDDSNWENYDFIDDVGKRLKISLKSIEQGMTRLPAFVNEIKFAISKPFLSEEDKNYFDNLSTEEQQEFVNKIGGAQQLASSAIGLAQMPVDAQESLEKSEETRKELEELESQLVQFDNTIAQDVVDGNIGRATVRTASQAIAAIPSVVQAFIPYVGIPSIVLGEAAKASGEAQRKGEDISLKTIGYSSIIGASEGLLEIFTKKIGKSVYKSLVNKPKEVVEKNIKDLVLNVSKSAGSEGLSESGTLTINKLADAVILKDEKAFDNYILELADTFIVGSAVGGPLRGTGEAGSMLVNAAESRSVNKELKNSKYENLTQAFEDPNVDEATVNLSENKYTEKFLDFDLKKKVESGELTTERAAEIKNNFLQTQGAANSLKPLNLSTTDKAQVIDLVKEKKSLENTIKQVDDTALTEPQNQRVKEINNLLRDFSTKAIVQETAKVKSVIEGLKSVGVKEPMSTKEIENYLLKNNIAKDKSDAVKKSGQGALIFQDPDTKEQTIIVNKDIGNIADASHEGLHALIYETVRKSPDTAIRLGESLQQELNKIDPNIIEDLGIRERLELYNEDPSAVRAEEVLTLFSDTVRTGAFKFNENVFTKIGDVIRQFLSSIGVKAKFNNGRDVYNFIKDYQRSVEKGKLTRGQERTATEGATGRLVGPKIETFVETPTTKDSRIYQEVETFKDDLVNEQSKDATAFLIADKLQNEVDRRLKIDVDPETREDIVRNFLFDDRRGLLGLLKNYSPARNESIMGYLNSTTPGGKLLDARLIEFYQDDPRYNQIIQSTTDEAVQRKAERVTAEETDVEVTEEAKGPRKPTETTRFSDTALSNLGVKNKAEAEKQISDATNKAFKGQDVTRFGQTKNVPVAVAEIYGKMFGVNPETIYDKKRNYSKKDAEGLTRIKQYLIDNATSDFARLPKTKDDFGKATFIPNNVMNALYTDGELTGTLKDYLDLIREKPVKPIYRDRVGQTIRGLFNTSIRNRMVEDLIPSKPERARAGVKFSKAKPKDINKKLQEIAIATDINQAAKIAGIKGKVTVNDDNRIEKQKQMQQAIIDAEIPSWMFEASKFGNFARRKVNGKRVDIPARGGLYYGKTDPAFQAALALAKTNDSKYNIKAPKRVNVNKAFTEQGQTQGKDNLKALEFVANKLADAVAKNQMPVEIAALYISAGYQATGGIVKIAAPFKYKSKTFKYGTTPNQKKDEKFREEHNPPASVIGANLIYGIANNDMATILPAITKNYYQTQLSKADDQKIDESDLAAKLPEGFSILDNSDIRLVKANISMESLVNPITGQTMAQELGVTLEQSKVNPDNIAKQNQLLTEVIKGERTSSNAQKYLNDYTKLESKVKASKSNNSKLPPGIKLEDTSTFDKFGMADTVARQMFPEQANSDAVKSGRITAYEALDPDQQFEVMVNVPGTPVENTIAVMSISDRAIKFARNADAPNKGISVWDFDDTLATTKSNVLYTMPDGTEGVLNAEQFAKRGEDLLQEGAVFDFSEFEKVTKGAKGPMFEKAVARNRKFGNDNVFILTARTQAAAEPIHQFLKAIGLDIPLGNIVGLGNSTPEAKARWVVGKAAEGYNDFYFADDAYKNVKAVQDALSVLDVKSKVRQAYVKHSKSEALDKGFNDILQETTGIASEKEYKKVKAEVAGASLGAVFRGIPYSAQDLVGLLYETLGKGKLGDSQMAWWKKHLLDPYARAVNDIDNARLSVMQDYRALKKQLGFVPKNLRKKIPGEPFTREQAVRVYIWNNLGYDVPGISQQDLKELTDYVTDNADLQVFADQVIAIQKGEIAKPKEGWPAGTITTDIQESINTGVRAKYLTQWQNNVDVIFSEKNMNKLEAAYGKKYRKAMENMLERMKTGRNRRFSDDSLTGRFTDWLQGSIGAIMFFNSRSALLQNLSSINFLNFTDNNPLAAARAFANQKQYWSDFSKLINSDFLKARRSGLRMNVNEADIADMAKKGGPRAVISKLLQFGFTPTQIADSFAIASGGATFYRNRIKTYTKQGLSQQEAEAKAFEDFRETAEESQQSARPDRISMQQAGPLGRLILAFQNTPSQYARIIDKSIRDLKNRRGDDKTNISKIVYYATVQNLIFNALQQALFAMAFDDEEPEDEEKKEKYVNILNSMADSLLRGTGVAGGVMSVTKNAIIRIIRESQKDNPNYEKVGADLQRIAPPVSSKLSKINQAARSFKWDKDEMINGGWGLDNPAYLAVGNVVSATTNIPMDRGVKKINNLMKASDSELETWERLALLGGWQDWEIGIDDDKKKKKPQNKQNKKESKLIKSKIRKSKTK